MTVKTENGVTVLEKRAVGAANGRRREREQTRKTEARLRQYARIIAVHHGPVVLGLVGEDAGFGRCVFFKAGVAVQVVCGQVEVDGHLGMEGVRALELEAGDLE